MTPEALLCHRTATRARLRVPSMRDDAGYFASVRDVLGADCGSVRVNARTASILLDGLHKPLPEIVRKAESAELFVLPFAGGSERGGDLVPVVDRAMQRLYRGPRHWPAEMAALMLLLAVVQMLRGQIMAPAISLLWYASEAMHWGELEARGGRGN